MKIRVVSDGTEKGTKVYTENDELDNVERVDFVHRVGQPPVVYLKVVPELVDLQIG